MSDRLGSLLSRVLDSALARPGRTMAAAGAGLLLLALCSLQLRVDGRVDSLLPEADRGLARYSDEVRRFGAGEMIFVDVQAPVPRSLDVAVTGVVEDLRKSPWIAEVIGGADQEAREKAAEAVFGHLPVLLPEADYAELEKRLLPEALEERMDDLVAVLLGPGTSPFRRRGVCYARSTNGTGFLDDRKLNGLR